jgi:hypothetical protein
MHVPKCQIANFGLGHKKKRRKAVIFTISICV